MITNIILERLELGTICKNESEYQHFTSMPSLKNLWSKLNQQTKWFTKLGTIRKNDSEYKHLL
jgi:hypothetical protein